MERVDAIVIGAGMAGIPLAIRLAHKGLQTVLVEKGELGGTCLNRGCIPTKTLIASAKVAHQVRRALEYGVVIEGPVRFDLARAVARKDALVRAIREGAARNLERTPNIELIQGEARFVGERTVAVGDRVLAAEWVFINTGARGRIPPIEGLETVDWLDSTTALDLTELPASLVIVGGGYIGCEFAQMFRRFGSEITIVQRAPQLLPQEDPDVAAALQAALEAEGIRVLLEAEAVRVRRDGSGIALTVQQRDAVREVRAARLMLAAGRVPNTDGLGLEATGVARDERGFIRVNPHLETTAPKVFALGDVRGGPMFTHTARDDARIVYQNLIKGAALSIEGRVVPYAVFTDPQLGRVGLTETAARQAGYPVEVGTYAMNKVAKARALGEPEGFIKIVADARNGRILGASVLAAEGAELVHELVVAIQAGATHQDLRDAIHIHPTLAEGISSALGGVHRAASDAG